MNEWRQEKKKRKLTSRRAENSIPLIAMVGGCSTTHCISTKHYLKRKIKKIANGNRTCVVGTLSEKLKALIVSYCGFNFSVKTKEWR